MDLDFGSSKSEWVSYEVWYLGELAKSNLNWM